jgi:hypothetical protein
MTKTEAMFVHVFVRRAGVSAAPFTWEIHGDGLTPLDVSVARYTNMQAAYEAGLARLTALIASEAFKRGPWVGRVADAQVQGALLGLRACLS